MVDGEPGIGGDVSDSHNSGGGLEPTGTLDASQIGLRGPLHIVEITRNAYGRVRQLCRIDAGRLSAGMDAKQQKENQCKGNLSAHSDSCPSPIEGKGKTALTAREINLSRRGFDLAPEHIDQF